MTDKEFLSRLDRLRAFMSWKPEDVEVLNASANDGREHPAVHLYTYPGARLRELACMAGAEVESELYEGGTVELSALICGCTVFELICPGQDCYGREAELCTYQSGETPSQTA